MSIYLEIEIIFCPEYSQLPSRILENPVIFLRGSVEHLVTHAAESAYLKHCGWFWQSLCKDGLQATDSCGAK